MSAYEPNTLQLCARSSLRPAFAPLCCSQSPASQRFSATGCKSGPVDDNTLAANVKSALAADSSIASEPIQESSAQGSVTLTGNVSNDTARIVAAQDAAKVTGVKQVVNDLSVAGQAVAPTIVQPEAPTVALPTTPVQRAGHSCSTSPCRRLHCVPTRRPRSLPRTTGRRAFRDVNGARQVRPSPSVSRKHWTAKPRRPASPSAESPTGRVDIDGYVAIPAGTPVTGTVVDAKDATHFKGHSILSITL